MSDDGAVIRKAIDAVEAAIADLDVKVDKEGPNELTRIDRADEILNVALVELQELLGSK